MVQEAPTKDKLTCLIPQALHKQAKQAALDYDKSVTQLVIEGLTELLEKKYPRK